jgi:hypothetical protein
LGAQHAALAIKIAHTAFHASVRTAAVGLSVLPCVLDCAAFMHPQGYHLAQAFARIAREALAADAGIVACLAAVVAGAAADEGGLGF